MGMERGREQRYDPAANGLCGIHHFQEFLMAFVTEKSNIRWGLLNFLGF